MVYTSEHLSLAVLENLVHLDPAQFRPDRMALTIEVPDRDVEILTATELPTNWRAGRSQRLLQDLGRAWIVEGRSLALKVPSAVIPQEHNVLLNPNHPRHRRLSVHAQEPFSFDPRLFRFPT